jgi:hypothetical protein
MVATLLRADLASAQWFKCRTNAGDVVQGGAGDDQRGREAQELRPQADEEESDRGDQAAAAHHEREGQSVILTLKFTIVHLFLPFFSIWGGANVVFALFLCLT